MSAFHHHLRSISRIGREQSGEQLQSVSLCVGCPLLSPGWGNRTAPQLLTCTHTVYAPRRLPSCFLCVSGKAGKLRSGRAMNWYRDVKSASVLALVDASHLPGRSPRELSLFWDTDIWLRTEFNNANFVGLFYWPGLQTQNKKSRSMRHEIFFKKVGFAWPHSIVYLSCSPHCIVLLELCFFSNRCNICIYII